MDLRLDIVVVSPSEAARRLLQLLLERLGHGCRVAGDGDEALDQLSDHAPSIVVVDARAQDEETLLLMGLLQRRFPEVARLTLHEGQMQLWSGGSSRTYELGSSAPQQAFPTQQELEDLLSVVNAEQLLKVLKPRFGLA